MRRPCLEPGCTRSTTASRCDFHTRTPYAGASQRYDRMPAKLRQAVIERDRRCVRGAGVPSTWR